MRSEFYPEIVERLSMEGEEVLLPARKKKAD